MENGINIGAMNWMLSGWGMSRQGGVGGCWYKMAWIGTDTLNNLKISTEYSRAGTIHRYIDKSWSGSPRYYIDTDLSNVSIFQCESSELDQSCKLVCVIFKTSPRKCYTFVIHKAISLDKLTITEWSEVARHLTLNRITKIREVGRWHKTEFPIWHSVKSADFKAIFFHQNYIPSKIDFIKRIMF